MSEDCPYGLCDGSGFIPDWDANVDRPCRCRPQRIARARSRSLSRVIPKRFAHVSFDRPPVTDMDPYPVQRVRAFADHVDERLDAGDGLWLSGRVGTGKTTLATLVARAAMDAGRSVAIYSMPQLIRLIRNTYDDGSELSDLELLDRLVAVDLLQLDDVGAERTSPWVLEQVYSIVNGRYEERRSVVLTSNVTDDGALREQIGERTVSRLVEMCERVPLIGEDQRLALRGA